MRPMTTTESRALEAEAEIVALQAENVALRATEARLRAAMQDACELLAERTQGSAARSPAHNARLRLEATLAYEQSAKETRPAVFNPDGTTIS